MADITKDKKNEGPKAPKEKKDAEKVKTLEEQKAEIRAEIEAEYKAKEKGLEKKAFDKVCEKLGTSQEQLDAIEKKKELSKEMMEYSVPFVITINGKPQPMKGIAPRGVVQQIVWRSAQKRMRLMREKISTESEVVMLASGAISSRVVKVTDASGDQVS